MVFQKVCFPVTIQEPIDHNPIKHGVELINTISFKLGRLAELTNHGDREKDTHFLKDHILVIIDKAQQPEPTNEDLRKWFGKGGKGGAGGGGWDRYSSTGERLGKCGGGKKVRLMRLVYQKKRLLNSVKKV